MSQIPSSNVSIEDFVIEPIPTSEASIAKGSELLAVRVSPKQRAVNSDVSSPTEHSLLHDPGHVGADYETLLDSPSAQKEEKSALFNQLAHFTIYGRPIINCSWKGFKYSVLTVASGTCIILYIPGALAYGRRKESDAETGQQLAGNTLPSAVVMLNASHHFINFKEDIWCVDQALGEWIDKSLAKIEPWETVLAVLASAISAFPLSIPAYQLNSKYSEPVRFTLAAIVQFDYTLNHTMAMWILINFPLTRKILFAPFVPFYYAGLGIYHYCLTDQERYAKALADQVAYDHYQMKSAMVATFTNAINGILKRT